uniref:Sema domain-containing protein n=1 Tax=Mesocestoides corti TaxID=53468 RepID=A0A5K3EMJ3_MESCO
YWTTWPQPILCLSVFQRHARKISSQPEKDTNEVQYLLSGMASVVDSDEGRRTCDSGLVFVNKAYSVISVTLNAMTRAFYIGGSGRRLICANPDLSLL